MVFLECGGDGGWLGVLGGYVKEGRLRPGGDGQRWRRARSRVVTPGGHENSGAASRRKRQLPSPSVGPSVADVVDHSLHRQARRRRVVSSVSRKRPPGGGRYVLRHCGAALVAARRCPEDGTAVGCFQCHRLECGPPERAVAGMGGTGALPCLIGPLRWCE